MTRLVLLLLCVLAVHATPDMDELDRAISRLEDDLGMASSKEVGESQVDMDAEANASFLSVQSRCAGITELSNQQIGDHIFTLASKAKGGSAEERAEAQSKIIKMISCIAPYTIGKSWDKPVIVSKEACARVYGSIKTALRAFLLSLPTGSKLQKSLIGDYKSANHEFEYAFQQFFFGKEQQSKEWRTIIGHLSSGCRKAKSEIGGPIMTDNEWRLHGEAQNKKTGFCDKVRRLTTAKAIEIIDKAVAHSTLSHIEKAKKITSLLKCLVPWVTYKYGSAWGQTDVVTAKKPQEGAKCDTYYGIVHHIATRDITKKLSSTSDARSVFLRWFEVQGIKLDLTTVADMLEACNTERPYRDFGTTRTETVGQRLGIKMSLDKGFPRDVENLNSMRLDLFCLHGIRTRKGKIYLRPGEQTSYQVGFDKYDYADGLSCTLNQGLDSVRRYKLEGHEYTCISTAFWFKKFGNNKHHFITEPDESCPYHWVEQSDSTPRNPHIKLAMKPRAQFMKEETPGANCEKVRNYNVRLAHNHLKNLINERQSGKYKSSIAWQTALAQYLSCFVPTRQVDQFTILRTKDSQCPKYAGMINKFAHTYAKWATQNNYNGYEVFVEYIERNLKIELDSSIKQKFDNIWEACGNEHDIAKKRGSFGQDYGTGPIVLWQLQIAQMSRKYVPNDFGEAGFRPYLYCSQGIDAREDRNSPAVPNWARVRDVVSQGASTMVIRRDEREPYNGLACKASVRTDDCSLEAQWRILGDEEPAYHFTGNDNANCPLEMVVGNGASKTKGTATVRVKIVPRN